MGAMMPATMAEQTGDVLTGIGASSGRVTAMARVLDGPADFARLQPGEVLVASITTPAWTSLFARAAAVVTDIGGPLSHSSIVAREYGIPAVLGTAVATRRVVDGQQITVDGDSGKVYLAEVGARRRPVAAPPAQPLADHRRRRGGRRRCDHSGGRPLAAPLLTCASTGQRAAWTLSARPRSLVSRGCRDQKSSGQNGFCGQSKAIVMAATAPGERSVTRPARCSAVSGTPPR